MKNPAPAEDSHRPATAGRGGIGRSGQRLESVRSKQFSLVWVLLTLALLPSFSRAEGPVVSCTEQALRAALTGGGVVSFSNDCSITLSQPITIGPNTTIVAGGHTVTLSGSNSIPIFRVYGNLRLVGLTLTGGKGTNGGAAMVASSGSLFAYNCAFAGNTAAGQNGVNGTNGPTYDNGNGGTGVSGTSGQPAFGGAIYNLGTVLLSNCTLSTNFVYGGTGGNGGDGGGAGPGIANGGNGGDGGAGAAAFGGAIYNGGALQLLNCTITGNAALGGLAGTNGNGGSGFSDGLPGAGAAAGSASGGGIYNTFAVVLSGCTFSGNTAQGGDSTSGGTYSNGNGQDGPRGADGVGGGLHSIYWGVLTNCTFSGNNAIGGNAGNGGDGSDFTANAGKGGDGGDGAGGGVYNAGDLWLVNCTACRCGAFGGTNGVAGKGRGGEDGAMGQDWGGNLGNAAGTFTLMNSLIAWETWGACAYGTFADAGYNLVSDNSISMGSAGSFVTSSPKLGLLGNYGGPTQTVPILADSPARNQIPPDLAPAIDQRGLSRPQPANGLSDIGAYEYTAVSPPVLSLVSGSVREGTNGLGGVNVAIGGTQVTTDTNGIYSASVTSGTYTVTPTLARYTFQPQSPSVTVPPNAIDVNFQAVAGVAINLASNGLVQISGGGATGLTYQVQISTNLVNWQTIATNPSPVVFTDPTTNARARFYRLRR